MTPAQRLRRHPWRWALLAAVVLIGIVAVIVALQRAGGRDGFTLITGTHSTLAYLASFFLVAADGVCALFPGETTLNAAATLAAQGQISLFIVIVAGAAGAICGDSALYWIARSQRRRYQAKIDAAMKNEKVAAAIQLTGTNAPTLLIFGRYVPGLRLVITATFGVTAHPYRNFLIWSAVGGTLWSIYTCTLAYIIGSALAHFPFASVIISGAVTAIAVTVVLLIARRSGALNTERRCTPTV